MGSVLPLLRLSFYSKVCGMDPHNYTDVSPHTGPRSVSDCVRWLVICELVCVCVSHVSFSCCQIEKHNGCIIKKGQWPF